MILLHELTKILSVNISFLHCFVFLHMVLVTLILKNPKRFSTTGVEKLIFEVQSAKHEEQVWESVFDVVKFV